MVHIVMKGNAVIVSEHFESIASLDPASNRFYEAREDEVDQIRESRHDKNTKKNTTWSSKLFREWLVARSFSPKFENLTPTELDKLLARFYVEARKEDGSIYSKSSLNGIRAALQRHLESVPWNWSCGIINNPAFTNSNKVLIGVFKKMTAEGLVKPRPKNLQIEPEDLQKLFETGVMGKDSPRALLNLAWFLLYCHFGNSKKEADGWRGMTKQTFQVGKEDNGRTYIAYSSSEKKANHQGEDRVYEFPDDRLCPVAAYETYLDSLNPENNALWQRPNPYYWKEGSPWYCVQPLGCHFMSSIMKKMSKNAHLSRTYTNHAVKSTTTRILASINFKRNDVN